MKYLDYIEYLDFDKMFNSIQMDEFWVVDQFKERLQCGKMKVVIVLGVFVVVMVILVYVVF